MPSKDVLVLGAGFSVPAKLPIQNGILKELIKNQEKNFTENYLTESQKYLHAFIEVGFFLLDEYSSFDTKQLFSEYKTLNKVLEQSPTIDNIQSELYEDIKKSFSKMGSSDPKDFDEIPALAFFDNFSKYRISTDDYYKRIFQIKEKIIEELINQKIDINLEEVFTTFDKTLASREHGHKYTYSQLDNLKNSIMRLFVYHFGAKMSSYKFTDQEYLTTINYIQRKKGNVSVITTNWDTLFENYLKRANLPYDLCLNRVYYQFDDKRKNTRTKENGIKYVKIHGSINWCKCLNCGSILIAEKSQYGEFLFNDNKNEKCEICRTEAKENSIQLQPEIITPTMIKSLSNQLFLNLWKTAGEVLSNAEKIIFVGYSLPLADYDFRYLLKRNIKQTAAIDVVLAQDDDPNNLSLEDKNLAELLPSKRYLDLFAQNKPNFYYKGFGDYFANQINHL